MALDPAGLAFLIGAKRADREEEMNRQVLKNTVSRLATQNPDALNAALSDVKGARALKAGRGGVGVGVGMGGPPGAGGFGTPASYVPFNREEWQRQQEADQAMKDQNRRQGRMEDLQWDTALANRPLEEQQRRTAKEQARTEEIKAWDAGNDIVFPWRPAAREQYKKLYGAPEPEKLQVAKTAAQGAVDSAVLRSALSGSTGANSMISSLTRSEVLLLGQLTDPNLDPESKALLQDALIEVRQRMKQPDPNAPPGTTSNSMDSHTPTINDLAPDPTRWAPGKPTEMVPEGGWGRFKHNVRNVWDSLVNPDRERNQGAPLPMTSETDIPSRSPAAATPASEARFGPGADTQTQALVNAILARRGMLPGEKPTPEMRIFRNQKGEVTGGTNIPLEMGGRPGETWTGKPVAKKASAEDGGISSEARKAASDILDEATGKSKPKSKPKSKQGGNAGGGGTS